MKISAGRADAFVRRPDPAVRVVLLFGPDGGLVRERGAALIAAIVPDGDPFRVAEMSAAEAVKDVARLVDEASALALTGGRRAIRVRDAGDSLTKTLGPVLEAPGEALIVVEAGDLPGRSSLRKLCDSHPQAATIGCYPADAGDLAALLDSAAAGRRVDREAAALFADRVAGDRQVARREIEKLLLYCDGRDAITLDDVRAVVGDTVEAGMDGIADAVADRDPAALDQALTRFLAGGGSMIGALRATSRVLFQMLQVAVRVERGVDIQSAMGALRPPVFPRQQPILRRRLGKWRRGQLEIALSRLSDAEAAAKRTGMPADAFGHRTLLMLAAPDTRRRG